MSFKSGNIYTFTTLAPAFLGERYENVKVIATGTYELASAISNVDVTHTRVYPLLPEGTEKDAQKLEYIIILTGDGVNSSTRTALATAWINEATIEEYQNLLGEFIVQVSTPADVQRIRNLLSAAGFNKVSSTIKGLGN